MLTGKREFTYFRVTIVSLRLKANRLIPENITTPILMFLGGIGVPVNTLNV